MGSSDKVYLKTSTGSGLGGATVESIKIMSKYGSPLKIKASGGRTDSTIFGCRGPVELHWGI